MPLPASDPHRRVRWGTYLIAFIITAALFGTAIGASAYFDARRADEVRSTTDSISVDILSLETQFDLLAQNSCKNIADNSVLSTELWPLGERLAYLESQGGDQAQITELKRYYSLLEIKDLLLEQQVADKCDIKPVVIMYFYSNAGDCADCTQQGYVLTSLADRYPDVRIYSFDYNLDLGALQTLISIDKIPDTLPALVINGKVYTGFKDMDAIHAILPGLAAMSSTTATSTRK
ncbi:MAG TPA: thioredoxin family protein [Candidatus Paceibacterota bacterium]|nr:thioredoxin family protein [Candidatus Paceibacterota bacterium]